VCECELIGRGMAPFEMGKGVEQLRVGPQGTRDRTETANVLLVDPAGVMKATVGVGEICDGWN
jgi:hypothetical protein